MGTSEAIIDLRRAAQEEAGSSPNSKLSKGIAVFGSTGSIGRSALSVVRDNPNRFKIVGLAAGSNFRLLAEQASEFKPDVVVIGNDGSYRELRNLLDASGYNGECHCGEEALAALARKPECELVISAIVGLAGLNSSCAALRAGKQVALANKETVVAAGDLVAKLCREDGGRIIPVDSEHSGLFQLLLGVSFDSVRSLVLTASGGPFLNLPLSAWDDITAEQAVEHPRWSMGPKISVDSATMVNKALEVIEAGYLFGFSAENIEVLVHPESIIHAILRLNDGAAIAHMSCTDMRGPIAFAMSYPESRVSDALPQLDLTKIGGLNFAELDNDKFSAVELAKQCLRKRGGSPAVFNAANERAVELFLAGKLRFSRIVPTIEQALARFDNARYTDEDQLWSLHREVCNSIA